MRKQCVLWVAAVLLATCLTPGVRAADGDDDGGKKIDWFATLRMRPEYNDNLTDGNAGRDDKIAYASYRVNLGFEATLDKGVSLVLDGQAVGQWGENATPLYSGPTQDNSSAKFNFFRAYAMAKDMFGTPFTFSAGRQPIVLGDEWILGDLDHYGGTSWDSAVGKIEGDLVDVSVFWGKGAEMDVPELLGAGDMQNDWDLYGVWTAWSLPADSTLDAAVIYSLDRRKLPSSMEPFSDKRATFTVNYHYGKPKGLFIDVNGAIQWGTTLDSSQVASVDLKGANAGEFTLGWTFEKEARGRYKLWGRWANYTGDDPATPENETYNPLAQDFHGRYGYLDFWHGWWGLPAFVGGTFGAEFAQLGFHSELENGILINGLYQHIQTATAPTATSNNRNLGDEFAFTFGYNYGKNSTVELAFAQLYPGNGLIQFGNSTVRRFFLNTVVRF